MNRKLLLSLAGGAAVVCIAYGTAQAAPATGSLEGLKTLGLEQSNVEQVAALPSALLAPPWPLALPPLVPSLVVTDCGHRVIQTGSPRLLAQSVAAPV